MRVTIQDNDEKIIYIQEFYRIDIARFVKEINSAYWTEVSPPEKEPPDEVA